MMRGKKIFITGVAGFIGSAFISRTVENNQIVVFDNLNRNTLKDMPFVDHPNLTLIVGDVLDCDHLYQAIPKDTNIVIHCAAIAGIMTALKNPVETMRVNLIGSANLLEAATHLPGCERVVCFSTSEVYGRQAIRPKEHDDSVIGGVGDAHWTYAASKLAEEHLAIAYYQEKGLPTTVLRPFNVYGPGQVGDGALRTFIMCALKDEPLEIHRDGTQIRSWCYVDDMVDALSLTIQNPKAVGESFNIGNPNTVITIYGLAKIVIRELNSSSSIIFTDYEYTDVDIRIPSVQKAIEVLGFATQIDLEEGILRTADFYRTLMA